MAGCGPSAHCYPQQTGDPHCTTPTGAGTQYDYCSSNNNCADIYMCINESNSAMCEQLCPVGFDSDCGCGVFDPDCANATSAVCEWCLSGSCSIPGCSQIASNDNAVGI